MKYQIIQGDNREALRTLADNSIDAIVTDPPYGIDFLGKAWDANTGALETYQECLRVLKPGGHILAFSAARTYHHLAVTLEAAGFEIRDQIMWIYSSGFPKSQDVGRSIQRTIGVEERKAHKSNLPRVGGGEDKTKAWDESAEQGQIVCTDPEAKVWEGWGTALKPAHEPIALARKPIKLSIAKNCQQWGVGALNIDATRVPFESEDDKPSGGENGWSRVGFSEQPVEKYKNQKKKKSDIDTYLNNKRGPMERAKIADGENIGMFDGGVGYKAIKRKVDPVLDLPEGRFPSNVLGEIAEPYQKYFYCPKVGRRERHVGFDTPETQEQMLASIGGYFVDHEGNKIKSGNKAFVPSLGEIYTHGLNDVIKKIRAENKINTGLVDKNGNTQTFTSDPATHNTGNNHPTVKPIELMKYLIRLITPPGGTVLDPFNGSGSTGCAAVELGYEYIGCELDPAYVDIARKRIEAWYAHTHPLQATGLFE
jgi:site-specific DNA-methyltransferase (adenine-specific)